MRTRKVPNKTTWKCILFKKRKRKHETNVRIRDDKIDKLINNSN